MVISIKALIGLWMVGHCNLKVWNKPEQLVNRPLKNSNDHHFQFDMSYICILCSMASPRLVYKNSIDFFQHWKFNENAYMYYIQIFT